ncbi:hypothetical protein BGX34_005332 [Mortierella sp. NVP85]|nr:hypothetical protein BGX34_005332 [Mortierella sp. NVP85]
MFSNVNSIPMGLMQSLALSMAGSRLLRDENDTQEQVSARGLSYIVFYTIFTNLLRWSYGFSLLVPKDKDEDKYGTLYEDRDGHEDHEEPTQLNQGILIDVDEASLSARGHPPMASASSTLYSDSDADDDDEPDVRNSYSRLSFFRSTNRTKHQRRSTHLRPFSLSLSGSSHQLQQSHPLYRQTPAFTRAHLAKKVSSVLQKIRQVLSPPLVTAILALIIGLVPVLRRIFIDSKVHSFILRPLESCGEGAIPMTLLCLGAQVVHFASVSSTSQPSTDRSTSDSVHSQIQRRRIIDVPSLSPYTHQDGDLSGSSSEEDDEDRLDSQLNRSGEYPIGSTRSHASSSTTLYDLGYSGSRGRRGDNDGDNGDDDDDEWPLPSSYNGSNGLHLQRHRFQWLSPTVFILVSRLVLVPLFCLPAILFWPKSFAPMLTNDPAFSLALVLIVASPTAINLIQLSQVKGFFEKEMAGVLFWSYCVFGLPCVLMWSLVGLWVAER